MKGGLARTDFFARFCRDEEAADATEYALMLSLIAMVIVGAVAFFGSTLSTGFNNLTARFPSF